MVRYSNDWGETADSIPAILAANLTHMNEEDYIYYLQYHLPDDEILKWCLKQPQFLEYFSDIIREAEDDYCESTGYTVEDVDVEEE